MNARTELAPGTEYPVPCVRAALSAGTPPEWVPVMGPPHDDAQFIGFKPVHLHVDWRFLNERQRRLALSVGGDDPHGIVISTTYPTDGSGPTDLDRALSKSGPARETFLTTRPTEYHGPFPPYAADPYWLEALARAHRDGRLDEGRRCPHRGADLSGIEPDQDGIITCPLHGLRWRADNGAAAPTGPPGDHNSADTGPTEAGEQRTRLDAPWATSGTGPRKKRAS